MRNNNYTKYELNQSPFYYLKSKAKLAKLLGITKNKLKIITKSDDLYTERKIYGKNGNPRIVEKTRLDLKRVQKRLEEQRG